MHTCTHACTHAHARSYTHTHMDRDTHIHIIHHTHIHSQHTYTLSLVPRWFPPLVSDHLGMQIQRGKSWEICSCMVTSARQHTEVVANKGSRKPFIRGLGARALARQHQYCSLNASNYLMQAHCNYCGGELEQAQH